MEALKAAGVAENTLVVFTSRQMDPWHTFRTHGGTAGLLRGAKGGDFSKEACGNRPFSWWPGKIKPAVVMDMGTTMDLLPTFCALSGTSLPQDRVYDGYDISPLADGNRQRGTGDGFFITVVSRYMPSAMETTKPISLPSWNMATLPPIR